MKKATKKRIEKLRAEARELRYQKEDYFNDFFDRICDFCEVIMAVNCAIDQKLEEVDIIEEILENNKMPKTGEDVIRLSKKYEKKKRKKAKK